jgi:Na+-driven multidrug efflux pump
MAGAGWAVLTGMAVSTAWLGWAVISGRSIVRLRWAALRWVMFRDILSVGAVASISTLQTTLTIALTTAVVARAGGVDAVAGYGTGTRLEYLLVPLVFGLGAPLVALVGTNIGAGQTRRALRIALTGGALAFAVTESIGLAAAAWPEAWLGLFGSDPQMLATGSAYLRVVGPSYGFFGLGLALYFASQGAGQLLWPLLSGLLRLLIAVGGGWLALRMTGSLTLVFAALAAGLVVYGVVLTMVIASGSWTRRAG